MAGKRFVTSSHPAASYAEAMARIAALHSSDGPEINPLCRGQALTHGRKVARVVVLLHGYTNCPQQFIPLATQLHARGCNVFVPRMPRHGLRDRLTLAQARLTAAELVQTTGAVLDIAQGLGEQVVVAGLSLGGTMAAWAAQHRADVARAVVMAPLLRTARIPAPLSRLVMYLALLLPSYFIWWDGASKAALVGPPYAYPRFATRAVAEVLWLSETIWRAAAQHAPAVPQIAVVTTPHDEAVDNRRVMALAQRWRAQGAAVQTYSFPADLALGHDFIDPYQAYQRTDVVYPLLMTLIDG